MTTIRRIGLATAVAAASLVLTAPAAAYASSDSGADFGQHVRTCTQTMGFTGAHNPGLHYGYAGWNGMPCTM
jgi:hypothetical protein